jgi:hypothetical protein
VTPGSVLVDPAFRFSDGTTGKKILVVLNDGHEGAYVFAKTTSQPHSRGIRFGCQASDRFANFYLPKGAVAFLSLCTWICLDEYFEMRKADMLQQCMSRAMWAHGVLDGQTTIELLKCALTTQDLSRLHASLIEATITRIESPNSPTI